VIEFSSKQVNFTQPILAQRGYLRSQVLVRSNHRVLSETSGLG
jgi:hypothetical protein